MTTTDSPNTNIRMLRIMESAGLLLLFSFFALIEGTIRMTANSKPTLDVDYFASETADGKRIIPVAVFLAAGVAEVIFGFTGVLVGFASLFLQHNNPIHTKYFAILQCVLGWFVFLTFVIADPILRASQVSEGTLLLSKGEQIALILLGNMLGSICFCYALQGGQFIFALRLMEAQQPLPEEENKSKNRMRALIWSTNMLLASFSTLFVGILLLSKDWNSNTKPVGAPPHVVWKPAMSIFSGIIMLGYSCMSFAAIYQPALIKLPQNKNILPFSWVFVTIIMMLNFSWLFGMVPGLAPPIPGSAQHSGLVLSVTILPLFHVLRTHTVLGEEEQEQGDADEGKEQEILLAATGSNDTQEHQEPEQPVTRAVATPAPAPVPAPAPTPAQEQEEQIMAMVDNSENMDQSLHV